LTWWIDEPPIRESANPTDGGLQALHAEGFTIAVSLLVESIQPPRYDKQSALAGGWSIHSIPIEEGDAPSFEQIRDFMILLETWRMKRKFSSSVRAGRAALHAWAPRTGSIKGYRPAMRLSA